MVTLGEAWGEHIKIPPLKDQGWDTKYSTVPPWLQLALPLIDALTGAPGGAFPVRSSEVVAAGQGYRSLSPYGFLSGHLTFGHVFITAFNG